MLEPTKLKLVLWDFDDTLCIHTFHGFGRSEHEYNVEVVNNGKYAWKYCSPNKQMKEFMELCYDSGIRQGLISATTSSVHANAKVDWVYDQYGIRLANYCVCDADAKIKMMRALSDAHNISPDEILLIDDRYDILEKAGQEGFQACTPMEIVNYVG